MIRLDMQYDSYTALIRIYSMPRPFPFIHVRASFLFVIRASFIYM